MSTGVTQAQIKALQKMTDEEFAGVLITLAGVAFGGSSVASGFFARFAKTKAAGYLKSGTAKAFIASLVGAMFSEAIKTGLDADIIKEKIIEQIEYHTGLKLEALDRESMKKAAGQLLADNINAQYGTTFKSFYPPSNIIDQVKQVIENEVSEALI